MAAMVTPIRAVERSPARQALAEAIARLRAREQEIADIRAAEQNFWVHKIAVRERVEKAQADLDALKASSRDRLAASLAGKEPAAAVSTLAARAELQDAQDALAEMDSLREEFAARRAQLEQGLFSSRSLVEAAATKVVAESGLARRVVQEFSEIQRTYIVKYQEVRWLLGRGVLPKDERVFMSPAEQDAMHGDAALQAAHDALQRDPDAALPLV